MGLDELIRKMVARPAERQQEPVYVPAHDYLKIETVLEDRIKAAGHWRGSLLNRPSKFRNFLLFGCEVRMQP